MKKNALVFRHILPEDLGSFAKVLRENNYVYNYVETPHQNLDEHDIISSDLLVVMGGPMGVYDAAEHPYISQEIAYVRKRLELNKPVLGICLGAQIIASALGSEVYPGPQGKELGWNPITLTPEGAQSSIQYLDAQFTNMFHWHGDTFELPRDSVLLASSNKYVNQAFSYGRNILALQCHPETRVKETMEWFSLFAEDIKTTPNIDLEILKSETERFGPTLELQSNLFLNDWLSQLEQI